MSKVLVIGDYHITPTTEFSSPTEDGLTTHLHACIRTAKWIASTIQEERPDMVVQMGDFADQRSGAIDEQTLATAVKVYQTIHAACRAVRGNGVVYRQILGNHDYQRPLLTDEVLGFIPRQVFVGTAQREMGGMVYLPHGTDWDEVRKFSAGSEPPLFVFGHTEIKGARFSPFNPVEDKAGITIEELREAVGAGPKTMVFFGHYHHPHIVYGDSGGVVAVGTGSVLARSFDDRLDSGATRGVVVYDTVDPVPRFIENPWSKKFVDLNVSDAMMVAGDEDLCVRLNYERDQEMEAEALKESFGGCRLVPQFQAAAVSDETPETNDNEIVDEYIASKAPPELMDKILELRPAVLKMDEAARTGRAVEVLSVHAHDFSILGDVEFHPLTGLHLVLGKVAGGGGTRDSNGAGKSSIFEALLWALYGKSPKGNGDEVIRTPGAESCWVEVGLRINGMAYTIKRHRKDPEHGNAVHIIRDQTDVTPRAIEEGNALILDALRMDMDTFCEVVLLRDDLTNRFMSLKFADRQRLLERVFNLEAYDAMASSASARLKEVENDLRPKERDVQVARSALQDLKTQSDSLQEQIALVDLNGAYEEQRALQEVVSGQQSTEATLQQKLDTAGKYVGQVMNEVSVLQEDEHKKRTTLTNILADIQVAQAEIDRVNGLVQQGRCPTCGGDTGGMGANLSVVEGEVQDAREREAVAQAEFQVANQAVAQRTTELSAARGRETTLRDRLSDVRRELGVSSRRLAQLNTDLAQVQGRRDAMNEGLIRVQVDIDVKTSEVDRLQSVFDQGSMDRDAMAWWVKALSTDGFRRLIVKQRIRYMNDWLRTHVNRVWERGAIEITEVRGSKIGVKVGTRKYEHHSRGERKRVDLLLQLLLNQLYRVSRGVDIRLLAFDEVLDGIDDSGLQVFLGIVRELAEGLPVYVTSHNATLKSMINNTLTFVCEGDVSRLEV